MSKLLVIEDNAIAREGLAAVLRQAGFSVITAHGGEEGLALLHAGPLPDLILLDMVMPGDMDGWQFLHEWKKHGWKKPVPILVTSGAGTLTPEWASAQGCAGILHKPIEVDELLREVSRSFRQVRS